MSTLIIYQNILLITIGKAIPITIEEPTNIQSLLLTLKIFCSNIPSIKIQKTIFSFALFFGLIHGLGFSNYFRLLIGKEDDKILPLIEFALGIEAAQIIIVLCILILGMILQNIFRVSKRDWVLVGSSIVVGIAFPMIIERIFW